MPVPRDHSVRDARKLMTKLPLELPNLEEMATSALGDSADLRAQGLAELVAAHAWPSDPRLTVVALYIVCPSGPGMCLVEEARVLQSPQPDVARLLVAYGHGSKIGLALEDRVKLEGTAGGWVVRSFQVAGTEELLP